MQVAEHSERCEPLVGRIFVPELPNTALVGRLPLRIMTGCGNWFVSESRFVTIAKPDVVANFCFVALETVPE